MYNQIIITVSARHIQQQNSPLYEFDKEGKNRLELSRSPTKVTPTWNSQPRCPFGIIRVGSNTVTPPI